MLHEEVNYKVKGTRPRGRFRTTWQKSMDKMIKQERRVVRESVQGATCLANTVCRTNRNSYSYPEIGEPQYTFRINVGLALV